MNQVIETRTAKYWLDEEGILHGVVKPNVEPTMDDTRTNIATMKQLAGGQRRPTLVDMRAIKTMSRESRKAMASDSATHVSAVALLILSPVSRVIGNFFIGFNRSLYPTRLFTDELEALAWLKGYL